MTWIRTISLRKGDKSEERTMVMEVGTQKNEGALNYHWFFQMTSEEVLKKRETPSAFSFFVFFIDEGSLSSKINTTAITTN